VVLPAAELDVGLAYAAAGALLFGVYLVVYKRYFSGYPTTVYVFSLESLGLAWYLLIAAVTYGGGPAVPAATPPWAALLFVGVAVAAGGASVVSIRALQVGDVSYAAPLSKLVPLFVLPLELAVVGGALGGLQVAGVLVATGAIYVANYDPAAGSALAPFRAAVTDPAGRLALASAAMFACVDVGSRLLLQELALAPQAVAAGTFVGIVLVTAPFALRQGRAAFAGLLPRLVPVAAAFAVGVHLVTLSFARLPASVASPIVNTQAVVAVLLGGLLLREEATGRRLAAAGLAVAGIGMLALG
jgi:drug/metabolite transporter (DMT)-like permease